MSFRDLIQDVFRTLWAHGRPAVGETVEIAGVRFTVIGTMDRKIQLSNYFSSDDESTWIPYSAANDLWNAKYANVLVFEPIAPQYEQRAEAQVLAAIATRQQFSPTDKKAIQMFGREEFGRSSTASPSVCKCSSSSSAF
jgi:putative ABC transport system permease protein